MFTSSIWKSVNHSILPLSVTKAICIADQVQFNPIQYVQGLAEGMVDRNGK